MFEVGDLVRLRDKHDLRRQLGIVTEIKEQVHIKSTGRAAVVVVYWVQLQQSDWEYTFFLEKLDN